VGAVVEVALNLIAEEVAVRVVIKPLLMLLRFQ
jgi:hypothetical protein